jgi:DNA-binding IclR family transcriptional regulator
MSDEPSQENEMMALLRQILTDSVASSQVEIATGILMELRASGCFSRSGRQMFASELKTPGPRATVYRVVSALEKAGLVDRESKYSGYFLSYNFSNMLEGRAEKWRKFAKGN